MVLCKELCDEMFSDYLKESTGTESFFFPSLEELIRSTLCKIFVRYFVMFKVLFPTHISFDSPNILWYC